MVHTLAAFSSSIARAMLTTVAMRDVRERARGRFTYDAVERRRVPAFDG